MKAAILTLGCKINQCESEGVAKLLRDSGYEVSFEAEKADLYIVNTCAVTQEADRKSRQIVHKLAKENPDARILVTGCSSQHDGEAFRTLYNVATVSGAYNKYDWIRDYLVGKTDGDYMSIGKTYVDDPELLRRRTREYVKIQDGCNRFCSYCIIPYVRGRSRSRSVESILAQVRASTAKEIVLTGVDLSDYGKDTGTTLAALLAAIAHPRIRLGSLEPNVVTEELLDVMRDDRFCKHFHLSMQSGSDAVLRAMNRKYTAAQFLDKVKLIRSYFPDANITTDYIAGFPTETEEDHRTSQRTIEQAAFGAMHVFPYSVREGTRAASMPQIPKKERARRAREIAALAERLRERYLTSLADKEDVVLTETVDGAFVTGYTTKYVAVKLPADTPLNELIRVRAEKMSSDGTMFGEKAD